MHPLRTQPTTKNVYFLWIRVTISLLLLNKRFVDSIVIQNNNNKNSRGIRTSQNHDAVAKCIRPVRNNKSAIQLSSSKFHEISKNYSRRSFIITTCCSSIVPFWIIQSLVPPSAAAIMQSTTTIISERKNDVSDSNFDNESLFFQYYPDWTGTKLPLRTIQESVNVKNIRQFEHTQVWDMGRWPDPILRRPADDILPAMFGTTTLAIACDILKNTARYEGAVGLAAQQCGINGRIIYLDIPPTNNQDILFPSKVDGKYRIDTTIQTSTNVDGTVANPCIIFINPRIVERSSEIQMRVWDEECLVLPPSFRATVLRDAWIRIEYQTIMGTWKSCLLRNELARAAQHEFDHDRGILITDHVPIQELENPIMQSIEQQEPVTKNLPNRKERIVLAYDRYIQDSIRIQQMT